jgi:hypothetical protein
MLEAPWVKETKREFLRNHLKTTRKINRLLADLRCGCYMLKGTRWREEIEAMEKLIQVISTKLKREAR